jgi:siroheme synthase
VTLATFAPIETAQLVITDAAAPRALLGGIRRRGVQVVVAGRRAHPERKANHV